MEYRIGHLAYLTRNMDEALQFYTGILGFTHAFSIPDDNGNPWIEYIKTPDGRFIELFYSDAAEPLKDESYMHLCLEVADCAAAVEELTAKGANLTSGVKTGKDGNSQAWIKDPDGRPIEIMQIVETSPQNKARLGK